MGTLIDSLMFPLAS